MSNSYLGFHKEVLTFPIGAELAPGRVVTVDATGIVAPAVDSDFIGVLESVRKNVAGVQMEGYVECRYSGAAPVLGINGLVADANGYVKASAAAQRKYKVLWMDTSAHKIGFLL